MVGLVGRSGAGKTTLLKLVCGFLKADEGSVYVDGAEQQAYSAGNRAEIGVLFTDRPIFNDAESVRDNFEVLKIAYGIAERDFEDRYIKLSAELGFGEYDRQKISSLSLGQRRRAELGAVLLNNPQILILDEPTSGLDENAKNTLRDILLKRLEEGMTVVISSHDIADISQICKRIAVLDRGKLLYYGNEELLIRQFMPMDVMEIKLEGKLPDPEDLPLDRFSLENNILTLTYNSNHITSAEILRNIMSQTSVKEVKISKSDLVDAIIKIERGMNENE